MKLCLVCHLQFSDEQQLCPKDNAQLVPLSTDPLIGTIIQDRYKIDSAIGKGAMGVVYKATQELIGREVAVKVLHGHLVADTESLKRFHQQARAASRLNHPHIITLYDYGVIPGGQPYIVMDLLYGTTLANLLLERQYLPVDEALVIFRQSCEALGDAHKHGVIHRDVKPENIVLEDNNTQKYWVKVVDFGIAKLVQGTDDTVPRITRTGTICGSPAYMSPEQFQGSDVDQRSDIYSLGAVIFETLTGRLPFDATDLITLMSQHVATPPPRLKEIRPDLDFKPELEKVVSRALAKNPEDRPQSMAALWDELQSASKERHSMVVTGQTLEVVTATPVAVKEQVASPEPATKPQSQQPSVRGPRVEISEAAQKATLPRPVPATSASGRLTRARTEIPLWVKVVGFAQGVFPYVLTLGLLCGLIWVVRNDTHISTALDKQFGPLMAVIKSKQPPAEDVQSMFDSGKYGAVRSLLEKKKKDSELSAEDFDILNKTYMRMADQEAKAKHYKNAIHLLQQVSSKYNQSSKAKSLIRKYKKLA